MARIARSCRMGLNGTSWCWACGQVTYRRVMGTTRDTHAVVVGCATGIGKALVDKAISEQMSVALIDVDGQSIEARARDLRAIGVDAMAIEADVADRDAVDNAVAACLDHFGMLDLVFLNAGIQRQGSFLEVSIEDHLGMLTTNLIGMTICLKSFLGPMVASGRPGRIVATASSCAVFTPVGLASYNASKGGVLSLFETVHHELEAMGSPIRLSVILPGAVATNLHDFGRYGAPTRTSSEVIVRGEAKLEHVLARYGMDPARVADVVFESIADDQFWLLPHPEITDLARRRIDALCERRNP